MPASSRLPLRLVAASTLLALAAAVGTYVALDGGGDDEPDAALELTPSEGTAPADTVTFTTFEGDEVPLAQLAGAPSVVNFFASTCAPCVKEMPALEEVYQELGDQVAFLGLAVQDRPEAALDLVAQTGVTYPTAQDKDGAVIQALQASLLPTTVLLDAEGEVVARHTGELDADELRQLLSDELGIEP